MTDDNVTGASVEGANPVDEEQSGAGAAIEGRADETTEGVDPGKSLIPAKDGKTVLDASGDDKGVTAPADWPEDWRAKLAGDDEKLLKRLGRMKSPRDVLNSWRALETKLSSGAIKASLPDDATEEQIAQYRRERGIPEEPDGYLKALPDGLVIGDEDKDNVRSFLDAVHSKNADPETVATALDWYYRQQEEQTAAQIEADRALRQQTEDDLRAEWGAEYRARINAITGFLDAAPVGESGDSIKDIILGARLSDGTPLASNPAAIRWLADMANEANPASFVAPGTAGSAAERIESRISEIQKTMRENPRGYHGNAKLREELTQLYEAQEKLKTR